MTQTIARIKQAGKHFEILVDMDAALKFKKTGGSSHDFLEIDRIFSDSKKGQVPPSSDLKNAFGTDDVHEIAEKIVKSGEVLVSQEHRDEERDKKFKQVIDFLATNSVDPKTGNPHTSERIRLALEQAHVNIKNVPIENQIQEIIMEISKVIPIKIEMKKIKITIPAIHTGKSYGIVSQYKEKENWLDNGNLEIVVSVPAGAVMNFFDRLNAVTHGSAITEEIKEDIK
ncbi:MAG: ribosome assembly factor SBDS [Nanoarchaeota archaeon]